MAGGVSVVHVQKVAGISGSERHLLDLVPQLRAAGWDARFVVLYEHEAATREFVAALDRAGVPHESVRMRGHVDPTAVASLARAFRRARAEIVHTHLVHADFHGLAAAALARVPIRVSTKHGFDDFRHRPTFALADRTVARLAHKHVAISEGLANYLVEVEGFRPGTFDVVHYGIAAGTEPPGPAEPDALVCVGRLVPIKGHRVLLDAVAAARERVSGLKLDIVGEGDQSRVLRDYARAIGVEDAVSFRGHAWPVEPVFERGAIVVVPSLGEGFGRVALEAMERARPVIASRVGGLAEVVEDGVTGRLVPPGSPELLADAMVELIENPDLARAMGAAGRRRAIERFSDTRCAEATAALYAQALAA